MSTARADRQLTALQNVLGLSDAGKAFLTAAIDPFHDEEIPNLRGFPDGIETRSCVQIMRNTMTIKCPVSVTSGTWDCNLVSYPFNGNLRTQLGTAFMGIRSGGPAGTDYTGLISYQDLSLNLCNIMGGISALSNASGVNLDWVMIPPAGQENHWMSTPVDIVGNYRIIGKGYEVISAGPDLYKSGTVYVWNQPRPIDDKLITEYKYFDGTAYWDSSFQDTSVFDALPSNVGAANSIPNTQSWPAKEGVYVVDRFDGPNRPTSDYSSSTFVYVNPPPYDTSVTPSSVNVNTTGVVGSQVITSKIGGAVTWNFVGFDKVNDSDFSHSGAYFTGLSLQDVLTVNVIWYIERVPTISQSDLMYLSKPTPCVDRVALDIYAYLASVMPVGMYQRANGFGDWFKDAVGVVTDVIAPVASVLPGPIGAIGKGALALGGIAKKFLPDTKPETTPSTYSTQERPVVIDYDRPEVRVGVKKKKSKLRKEDGKALMDLNSLKQELKSMRSKMKKKKKK